MARNARKTGEPLEPWSFYLLSNDWKHVSFSSLWLDQSNVLYLVIIICCIFFEIFGKNIRDAMLSQGILIVMHQGDLVRLYSFDHILEMVRTQLTSTF
jgi:hypothetical protein